MFHSPTSTSDWFLSGLSHSLDFFLLFALTSSTQIKPKFPKLKPVFCLHSASVPSESGRPRPGKSPGTRTKRTPWSPLASAACGCAGPAAGSVALNKPSGCVCGRVSGPTASLQPVHRACQRSSSCLSPRATKQHLIKAAVARASRLLPIGVARPHAGARLTCMDRHTATHVSASTS